MEGKKEAEERDEIIARLVVCCHPDQIAPPFPSSISFLLPPLFAPGVQMPLFLCDFGGRLLTLLLFQLCTVEQ